MHMLTRPISRLMRSIGMTGPLPARMLSKADVADARQYIRGYWPSLRRSQPHDKDDLIGLPYPYMVSSYAPDHDFDFNEMYYWDSYMIAQGLMRSDRREDQEVVEGMLENLLHMVRRFGLVPNGSRTYMMSRSQPPFLTSYILEVYHAYDKDDAWLAERIEVAKREYEQVWMGKRKPHARQVYKGLSRNYSTDMTHDQAELESGWDYTPRFQRHCLDYLPVDLNALLYKYEVDFSVAAGILGDMPGVAHWHHAANRRKRMMNKLMWDRRRGLFYDYDYVHKRRSPVSSLAAYYCLWAGLATRSQAAAMVLALRRFEHPGGLTATDDIPFPQRFIGGLPTQWAYPNGWAPLHWLVIRGLERSGHKRDARRLAAKWLRTNLEWYGRHGNFLEKYNVVEPGRPPASGVYPSQTGFGWTNAIFERLCRDYIDR